MSEEAMTNGAMTNEPMNNVGLRGARSLEGIGRFAWRKRC